MIEREWQPPHPHTVISVHTRQYRLFKWSLQVVDKWLGAGGSYACRFEHGTTPWHFRKTSWISMPLVLLSNIITYVGVFFILLVLPVMEGGIEQYLAFWFLLVLIAIGIALLILIIHTAFYFLEDYFPSRKYDPRTSSLVRNQSTGIRRGVKSRITFTEQEPR